MLSGFELYPRWVPLYYPSSKDKKLIQYLESRMKNMKYAESKTILDYLITMYLFALNLIFCLGKKEKKLNRLSRLLKKIYHVYLFVLSSVYGHYFQ